MRIFYKEYARVIEWNPAWSGGAPCPQVFSNGHEVYLIYYTNDDNDTLAMTIFSGCHSFRFGIVNDEASNGHPLYHKGLNIYKAHIIENSSWIEELKKIHKVHPRYSSKKWEGYKHYLFFFHDEIFEIITTDYKIERVELPLKELAIDIAIRLNS
jgi:hypothetical protein